MEKKSKNNLIKSAFTAAFAALICVACVISIPLPGGVPIAIQDMLSILSACILGVQGAGAVGLFILLGTVGLPVFSGGIGGIGKLIGPTGGYIWGYFLAALVVGFIMRKPSVGEKKVSWKMVVRLVIALVIGNLLVYVPGVPWFMHVMTQRNLAAGKLAMTFKNALSATVIPFIPGALIKMAVSIPLTLVLRPVAARFLYPADVDESTTDAIIRKYHEEKGE